MLATKILSLSIIAVYISKCVLCSNNEMPIDKADNFGVLGETSLSGIHIIIVNRGIDYNFLHIVLHVACITIIRYQDIFNSAGKI